MVRAAAAQALVGSDADVHTFLTTGIVHLKQVDDRINVDRLLAAGGPAVQAAAQQALDSTAADALPAFIKSGWQTPAATDQRIRIDQLMSAGGAEVHKAAQQALDAGTTDAYKAFLTSGWQTPFATDQRIRVNQILASGGPEVQKVAQRALDANSVDALTQFIDNDWAVAAARDQETATVEQLAGVAKDAGEEAARETHAAQEEADRAAKEAEAARQAAAAAATAAANAGHHADQATDAARQAAVAADNAAAAAQEAVGAANAATAAARVAASAAARAASAASMAGQAASAAYNAAAAAVLDQTKAGDAATAAKNARDVAAGAQRASVAATAAGDAAKAAHTAAAAADHAGSQAATAAESAAQASADAENAGADAAQAKAAAAKARAAANRAHVASQAALTFANAAADAAYRSRDAANLAAQDAIAAAAAAEDAAAHAGQATDAANKATLHANNASAAAQRAIDAANQAQQVYDAARAADAARIQTSTEQLDEAAKEAKDIAAQQNAKVAWDATQAAARTAETNRLIAEANAPGTDRALALTDARKVALAVIDTGGPWTKAAATSVLQGSDDEALDFVRSGITMAAGQDDRMTLQNLAATATPNFQAAAKAALAGSDADVQNFLQHKDYPQRYIDDRIAVNQILAAAQQSGGTAVASNAQQALDANTDQALRDFLAAGQYPAAADDQRIKVDRVLADPNSGPELKADAQAALDGPPAFLNQFLTKTQYIAAQHDSDSATHDAEVLGYLKQASEIAVKAAQDADAAQLAAANARGSAQDATNAKNQAAADALAAQNFANQAHDAATRAEQSAQQAAASAATARNAAASADGSARQAAQSAEWAVASAYQAGQFASDAYDSSRVAFNAARAAGKSADDALAAARETAKTAISKIDAEKADALVKQAASCKAHHPDGGADYDNCIHLISQPIADRMGQALSNAEVCQGMQQASLQMGGNTGVVNENFQTCMKDVLDPNFQSNRTMDLLVPAIDALLGLAAGLAVATIGGVATAACAISEICALAVMAITPDGAAFTPWMTLAGIGAGGAFTTARVAAALDDALVDTEALDALYGDNAYNIFSDAEDALATCPAGVAGGFVANASGRSGAVDRTPAGSVAARPNAASGPCKAIALGWTEYDGEWDWLAKFATKVEATPYTDWLWKDINKLQWWDEFEYYLTNGETKIYVNLDGIPEGAEDEAAAAGQAADSPEGPTEMYQYTNWELYKIKSTPSAWNRVSFYRDAGNTPVPNPFDK
ncbi:hypothetical protein GCM10018954_069860 [Kutzneria kofuensis]